MSAFFPYLKGIFPQMKGFFPQMKGCAIVVTCREVQIDVNMTSDSDDSLEIIPNVHISDTGDNSDIYVAQNDMILTTLDQIFRKKN